MALTPAQRKANEKDIKNSYFSSRLRLLYKRKTAWLLGFSRMYQFIYWPICRPNAAHIY